MLFAMSRKPGEVQSQQHAYWIDGIVDVLYTISRTHEYKVGIAQAGIAFPRGPNIKLEFQEYNQCSSKLFTMSIFACKVKKPWKD